MQQGLNLNPSECSSLVIFWACEGRGIFLAASYG